MADTSGILFSEGGSIYKAKQDIDAFNQSASTTVDIAKQIAAEISATLQGVIALNAQEKKQIKDQEVQLKLRKLESKYQELEEQHLQRKSKFNINFVQAAKDRVKQFENESKRLQEQLEIQKEILGFAQENTEEYRKAAETISKLKEDIKTNDVKTAAAEKVAAGSGLIVKTAQSAADSLISRVDGAMNIYSNYMGKIAARLQSLDLSSEKTFDKIQGRFSALATSPYVNQRTLYENLDRLTSEGISYNVEERAFLASLADKMVNSFDVGNATLTRLIRLYQEDFTQAMLGNEAWLTQMFNMMYEDTSYLKNVDDNILAALTDVMSTMNRSDATAFQFEVQKWLGSLYEVGMSAEALTNIASALNALGTGNASAFESSAMSTLLNLAIARSDYSLADILTQGLTSDAVNDILKSVVELLIDIKDNTSNQATLNAYAGVMGLSFSDIRGAYNLKSDLPYLWSQMMNLETAEKEVSSQIQDIANARTTIQEKINNIIDNIAVATATNIDKTDSEYLKWVLGKALVSMGSNIPGVVGMGASVTGYIELIARMFNGFASIPSLRNTDIGTWDVSSDEGDIGIVTKFINFFNNIGDIFRNFNNIESLGTFLGAFTVPAVVNQRGASYGVVKPSYGNVTSSTSLSYGVGNISSSAPAYGEMEISPVNTGAGLQNLEVLSTQHGYGYDVFSSENPNEGYNEYDVYQELFYHQEHPIRVHISHFDADALGQLLNDAHMQADYENLTYLKNQAEGSGINVDLGNEDAGVLASQIYRVMEMG